MADNDLETRMTWLLERVPDDLRPLAVKYGPVVVRWTAEELWAWIELLAAGKWQEAYGKVLAGMGSPDLLHEWTALLADWAQANVETKARRDVVKEAATAVLLGLLRVALIAVGL